MKALRINDRLRIEHLVTCNDIDADYMLTTSSALAFFQDTVASYLSNEYLGTFDIIDKGIIWVIADYSIQVDENLPMWLDKTITEITVSEITSMRSHFDFTTFGKDYKSCIKGTGCWSMVDRTSGRPVALDSMATIVDERREEDPHITHRKMSVPAIESEICTVSHLTTAADMDFNHHVNNRSYVINAMRDIASMLGDNFYMAELKVRFLKQSFIGDELSYVYSKNVEGLWDIQVLRGKEEKICHMVMNWKGRTAAKPDIAKHITRYFQQ